MISVDFEGGERGWCQYEDIIITENVLTFTLNFHSHSIKKGRIVKNVKKGWVVRSQALEKYEALFKS
ncbi:hypothetical protein B4W74_05960 [Staphylococcus intermedius]|nr:hypothetical protein B5C04_05610 [Staphylococcus intermedius]PNZ54141.1 hypothetical protein CD138_02440 [Staphylococcus intermedius NCTC 11048]PCF81207.1 hypothetical protein B4W74_05960 [Staphylococcus intermedius]PCF82490.1 hypothetical protein B4W70_05605 [Staphylococcus intermedius]PCF87189.1 hypothetical protein B4W75_08875 [Staphylococcus intermedius]